MEPISASRETPLFTAVSSSARQLFHLLRCIGFASKAELRISKDGLRFTVEESQVMQGLAFLEKSLFTSYIYSPPTSEDGTEEEADAPVFQISLSSLLETLQIFGISEAKDRSSTRDLGYGGITASLSRGGPAAAFENRALGMAGMCRISYYAPGDPLSIILEEAGVTTTCELVTYEAEIQHEIPLQTDALTSKIIMRANLLYDAITELSSTSPTRLTMLVSPDAAPHFTVSASGPFGSATVEFSKNHPDALEKFDVRTRTVNSYKYSLIKGASWAMAIASKVSIRQDVQGVLSLQFMIVGDGDVVSFVDFRFVPFELEEGEGEGKAEEGEGEGGAEEEEEEEEEEVDSRNELLEDT